MAFWFLSSPLLWNWGLPCLSAPAPLLLDLGCPRPNLADQSTRPGFSKTIFSTRSKLESQVALPDSIFPNTAACTCNNLGHSMYCDLYAVVFNISSCRQASLSGKLPPMIISTSPATNKPNGNFLKSISSPLHPHKYSGCRAACGYFCLFTIVSICLSLMPEYTLPSGFWPLLWQTLFETRAADGRDRSWDCLCLFVLPRFWSRLAREKQRLVPISELSGPPSVDVPGDGDPWRRFVSPAISCSTSVRASAYLPWPWPCVRSRAARDNPRDWWWPLASDTDVNSSICRSCAALGDRSFAISSRSCNALRSCVNTRNRSCSLANSASSASSSVSSSSSVVIYCDGSSDKSSLSKPMGLVSLIGGAASPIASIPACPCSAPRSAPGPGGGWP